MRSVVKPRVLALVVVLLAAGAGVGRWLTHRAHVRDDAPTVRLGVRDAGPRAASPAAPRSFPALPSLRRGQGDVDLSGRVEDAEGAPLAGVAVEARAEAAAPMAGSDLAASPAPAADDGGVDPVVAVAITDDDGRFELAGLDEAHYRLELSGEAIFESELRFVAAPAEDLSIVAQRRVSIIGHVVGLPDDSVAPALEVVAEAADGAATGRARIDASGDFLIEALPEGRYRVSAHGSGLAAPTVEVVRRGAGPFEAVHLVVVPAFLVSARVLDDDDQGVAAEVELTSADGQVHRTAVADASGTAVFEGVLAGIWLVRARAPGFLSAEGVEVVAGAASQPVVRLSRGATVAGTVVDGDGRAVAGASMAALVIGPDGRAQAPVLAALPTVSADQRFIPSGELGVLLGPLPLPPAVGEAGVRVAIPVRESPASAGDGGTEGGARALPDGPVVTGSDGAFSLSGLAPGRYLIVARHPDYADGRSPLVTLRTGQERRVRIVMPRGIVVAGDVTSGGEPVEGAMVSAGAADQSQARFTVFTDARGHYRLGPVSGHITVRASAIGYGEAAVDVALASSEQGDTQRTVDLELATADAEIRGRVRDSAGFDVPGARVDVVGNALRTAVTDEHGRFVIGGLAPGSYELSAHAAGYVTARASADTGTAVELALRPAASASFLVRDRDTRAPVAGARLVAKGPTVPPPQTSDERGVAVFHDLAPGRYRVAVDARSYAPQVVSTTVAAPARPGEQPRADTVVDLVRGAHLAGTVRDADGERVPGATVSVGPISTHTDSDGHFEISRCPPGDIDVRARLGRQRGRVPLTLAPGEELVTLQITLGDTF